MDGLAMGQLLCLTRDEIKDAFDRAGIGEKDALPASEFANTLEYLDWLIEILRRNGYSEKEATALAVRGLLIQQRQQGPREQSEEIPQPPKPPVKQPEPRPKPGTGPTPGKPSRKLPKRRKDKKRKKGKRSAPPGGRRRGVGNRTKAAYPNARELFILLAEKATHGAQCPCCRRGKLSSLSPLETLRFEASCLIIPVILKVGRSRCRDCGQVFAAELPPEYRSDIANNKATPEAAALSILLRYGLGFPDLRLDRLQDWQSAPFDNSRQWKITDEAFRRLAPLSEAFLKAASNATLRMVDDCSTRIIEHLLSIREEIANAEAAGHKADEVRTGINITTYIAEYQGRRFVIFFPGREHQGEREFELQTMREEDNSPICVSDAASKGNASGPFPEKNEAGYHPRRTSKSRDKEKSNHASLQDTIKANCLEHLRQTFKNAQIGHKRQVDYVLGLISKVFDVDAETREMSNDERLAHHQKKSAPLLDELLSFVKKELSENRTAEPVGKYRTALLYVQKHWNELTTFLRLPGVPLTTNEVESANRFTKQQGRPSLSYQTQHGAKCAAFFMSLIATCLELGKNPLSYLTAVLRYWQHITADNAFDWMPHTYELAVQRAEQDEASRASPGYELRHRHRREKAPVTPVSVGTNHTGPPSESLHAPIN